MARHVTHSKPSSAPDHEHPEHLPFLEHETPQWELEIAVKELQSAGLRSTLPRLMLWRVLNDCQDPVNVQELHRRIANFKPRVPVNTLYATLRILQEKDLVRKLLHEESAGAFYILTSKLDHQQVVICNTAGTLQWVDEHALREAVQALCRRQHQVPGNYTLSINVAVIDPTQ